MDQQFLPLLNEFLDMLAGKDGFLLSMLNGGGMNFWGVFFFFLCSPFTFLALLWERADMALFLNILVLCKLCAAALTASVFFRLARPGGASLRGRRAFGVLRLFGLLPDVLPESHVAGRGDAVPPPAAGRRTAV